MEITSQEITSGPLGSLFNSGLDSSGVTMLSACVQSASHTHRRIATQIARDTYTPCEDMRRAQLLALRAIALRVGIAASTHSQRANMEQDMVIAVLAYHDLRRRVMVNGMALIERMSERLNSPLTRPASL